MKPSYWITLVLVSVLVIFIVQNAAETTIKLLFWNINISMALLLFFIFLLGFVIGMLWFNTKKSDGKQQDNLPAVSDNEADK